MGINGNQLAHAWNDTYGRGSGTISSLDNKDGALAINWQSECIPPAGSSNEPTRQLLTARIDHSGESDAGGDFGFSALFTQARPPEILYVCSRPWHLPVDGSLADYLWGG
ncbi:hypothetical protein BDV29DRAFT_156580 [Aspergillus leporis]|uniref:Uncharacterized protein n=1 Tax=Aspergillus leporis TaxID=41062 RepID=A0A5N5X389_9EURO|nr:hypothetical protein BDV29DRAFT_156580 [Aspergillus leporis]